MSQGCGKLTGIVSKSTSCLIFINHDPREDRRNVRESGEPPPAGATEILRGVCASISGASRRFKDGETVTAIRTKDQNVKNNDGASVSARPSSTLFMARYFERRRPDRSGRRAETCGEERERGTASTVSGSARAAKTRAILEGPILTRARSSIWIAEVAGLVLGGIRRCAAATCCSGSGCGCVAGKKLALSRGQPDRWPQASAQCHLVFSLVVQMLHS